MLGFIFTLYNHLGVLAMHYLKFSITIPAAILALFVAVTANAGVYADDMSRCLVNSSSAADRGAFVKWLFSALALNPDVESMAVISSNQRDEINKNAAALLQKLITVTCRTEVQKAVKYEGPQTIQQAFQVFGQVAGRELMTSPRVAEGMVGLEKYIDEKKMKDVMIGDTSK